MSHWTASYELFKAKQMSVLLSPKLGNQSAHKHVEKKMSLWPGIQSIALLRACIQCLEKPRISSLTFPGLKSFEIKNMLAFHTVDHRIDRSFVHWRYMFTCLRCMPIEFLLGRIGICLPASFNLLDGLMCFVRNFSHKFKNHITLLEVLFCMFIVIFHGILYMIKPKAASWMYWIFGLGKLEIVNFVLG